MRPGRGTNLALAGGLALALLTGGLAFGFGAPSGAWAAMLHGATGLAVLLLSPWKSVVARRGMGRRRSGRLGSLALALLAGLTVVTGLLHATGLVVSMGPVSAMQIHVGAGLLSLPLAVRHMRARPVPVRRVDLTRRNMLRTAALAAGAAAATAGVEALIRSTGLPGGERRFTGSHERGSGDPAAMPVTQWLDDRVPTISPDDWALTIRTPAGETRLGYDGLVAIPAEEVEALLDCTGGWYAAQTWSGVRLDLLVGTTAGADAGTRSLMVRSATGYARRFPLGDLERLWLATRVGGKPLSPGHGFPARVVAPGRRGFWWVKWVTSVEASPVPWWAQSPFPLS
ncbi:MAG: molybdopterin-dependent oxidoreductase [Acidimicrobiia bacterium]